MVYDLPFYELTKRFGSLTAVIGTLQQKKASTKFEVRSHTDGYEIRSTLPGYQIRLIVPDTDVHNAVLERRQTSGSDQTWVELDRCRTPVDFPAKEMYRLTTVLVEELSATEFLAQATR